MKRKPISSQHPVIFAKPVLLGAGFGAIIVALTLAFSVTQGNPIVIAAEGANTGEEASPATTIIGTVTDIDGNAYATAKIGDQVWMAENLRTTRLNDGTKIPLVKENGTWNKLSSPGYCRYYNKAKNKSSYGALYNWYAVDTKKLAPKGWHIPSDAEWTTLENRLIVEGYNWDTTTTGNKIGKSLAAKTDWNPSVIKGAVGNDPTGNNSSGFAALPGGYRDFGGRFYNMKNYGVWWSSKEHDAFSAWVRCLYCNFENCYRTYDVKRLGFSVRCVKD